MSSDNKDETENEEKQLSNPFSTGSGGARFEVQVQSAFATLMLAGSFVPCLPCLPIKQIKLQARVAGYSTDDFVAFVTDINQTKQHRLLTQIKHGISFTKSNKQFRETLAAAWKDYNNPASFTRGKDAIAVVAGPLSETDIEDTRRILEWARSCASSQEFFEKINTTKFSSKGKQEKLAAFRAHINAAAGTAVDDEETFEFLQHFHILGFDLDLRSGLMHALMHGIIGRYGTENPAAVWARILEHVATFNQDGGTLTADSFPDDVRAAFLSRAVEVMPTTITATLPPKSTQDWNASEFAEELVVANLIGGWHESESDMSIVAELTDNDPKEWLRKIKEVLQRTDSPLSHTNGVWIVKNRIELWTQLSNRIFGDTLRSFEACANKVLREHDPKFELDPEQRFAASIYNKRLIYSESLRKGLTETVALLGTNAAQLNNCGPNAGEVTALLIVRKLFDAADWQIWASLERLLPTLAEAAPNEFLNAIEAALGKQPCPFDTIFAQEGSFYSGGTYMSGLLWALESLAWNEAYIVRVSAILAMLAARDPGGNWANRPANSLTTIFLPWFPQTHAAVEKRVVAVQTVVNERCEVGWQLLQSLLPQRHATSMGTYKPKYRHKIDPEKVPRPTTQEYWDQVTAYAKIMLELVRLDSTKLSELIDSLDSLPEAVLNQILAFLESDAIASLTDESRLPIWTELTSFVKKHRRHAKAEWALPEVIVNRIDEVATNLIPRSLTVKHRVLFVSDSWDLYDDENDWQSSRDRLAHRQLQAIREVRDIEGIQGVIAFATQVENPHLVGFMLGKLDSIEDVNNQLPSLIVSNEIKLRQFAQGFIGAQWQREQWNWFDNIDKSMWSKDVIAHILFNMPFDEETWRRANELLGDGATAYWEAVPIHPYQSGDSNNVAVDALLMNGRPQSAVACIASKVHDKQKIDPNRTIDALLESLNSNETSPRIDAHTYATVIKALQDDSECDKNKLLKVEWGYLRLLEHSRVTDAKTLNSAIANDPKFYCHIIAKIFRSDREKENQEKIESTEAERMFAQNGYRLLHNWSTVPGIESSGDISEEELTGWLDSIQRILTESGHLSIGIHKAGEVFIHAPADPGGLFIHKAVAAALNREDMGELRRGYEIATRNSRGAHFVDPTGAPEKQLAASFNQKAEAVENAGFHRLAVTLRSIAESYLSDAQRIIEEHKKEIEESD